MAESKDFYESTFLQIQEILNEIDPENLGPGQEEGAPVTEYNIETSKLTGLVLKNLSKKGDLDITEIIEFINDVWLENFGTQCADASRMAKEILYLIKKLSN